VKTISSSVPTPANAVKFRINAHCIKSIGNIRQAIMAEASIIVLPNVFHLLRIQRDGSAMTFGDTVVVALKRGAAAGTYFVCHNSFVCKKILP
jgi:hypothetical protein